MDNELLLFDRIEIIKTTIAKYGEDNFYLSFSGGKDSTVLHYLLDMAIPNNQIPRVYIDTGIEYLAIRQFVLEMAKNDKRIVIIKPTQAIKPMLEKYGYPFKSKEHSTKLNCWQLGQRETKSIKKYMNFGQQFACPTCLKYQFSDSFKLKVSPFCCRELKKKPVHKWEKQNNRLVAITGMRKEEGGQRANIKGCVLTDKNGKIKKFHPLLVVDDSWEEWFIKEHNIQLCELYLPPFNFKRTGCAGCPFALDLESQLETMERLLPNQRRQCEIIWKPVYDEYRRINYRLKKAEQIKLF